MKWLSVFTLLCILTGCASNPQEKRLLATLYAQKSAESRALYYQAFEQAKMRLTFKLANRSSSKIPAVVLDVDETIIDNSAFQAQLYKDKKSYNKKTWDHWIQAAVGTALPGAKSFLDFAKRKGVAVILITNRRIKNFEPTFKNLKEEGLILKRSQLIMRTDVSSKDKRRHDVMKKYEILLLLGDSLGDLSGAFEVGDTRQRNLEVDKQKRRFGRDYIIFPNPMYGLWERKLGVDPKAFLEGYKKAKKSSK
ncbi:MAG: 5'-nucleotidase, lipoprotein e(P4) family [Halobacteriovoraceae bacterium]|jgi:5'-nucleotidase (lipoprotein e(P4) family)|nr:5'-nucleotidase, lipoprotein e(P4) family [Halobacteriovoraceae bacterium]MBT5094982.1 5'-nucleotidase, lipoprotein e(P4) family [Halobacteriovoraceae bacterium]